MRCTSAVAAMAVVHLRLETFYWFFMAIVPYVLIRFVTGHGAGPSLICPDPIDQGIERRPRRDRVGGVDQCHEHVASPARASHIAGERRRIAQ